MLLSASILAAFCALSVLSDPGHPLRTHFEIFVPHLGITSSPVSDRFRSHHLCCLCR